LSREVREFVLTKDGLAGGKL